MTGYRKRHIPVRLNVFSGDFASQPLVFAHILDTWPRLDLDAIDVIQGAGDTRLAGYFEPQDVARIQSARRADNTCVILRPDAGDIRAGDSDRLRWLGEHLGRITRLIPDEAAP